MKNITVSVDDEVYRQARVTAARNGTSVSAIVANYLKALAHGSAPVVPDPSDEHDRQQRKKLANLFREANLVLGYKPTREKTYER